MSSLWRAACAHAFLVACALCVLRRPSAGAPPWRSAALCAAPLSPVAPPPICLQRPNQAAGAASGGAGPDAAHILLRHPQGARSLLGASSMARHAVLGWCHRAAGGGRIDSFCSTAAPHQHASTHTSGRLPRLPDGEEKASHGPPMTPAPQPLLHNPCSPPSCAGACPPCGAGVQPPRRLAGQRGGAPRAGAVAGWCWAAWVGGWVVGVGWGGVGVGWVGGWVGWWWGCVCGRGGRAGAAHTVAATRSKGWAPPSSLARDLPCAPPHPTLLCLPDLV